MKNKYTIAYIGAIIALPVALLFIVPAVATTNAFDWNGANTAQSSFAEAEANAFGSASAWSWGTGAGAEAETDSDAFAHASSFGDDAEAEADADAEGHAWSWTNEDESGVTEGGAYAWNTGSAYASAHVHTSTCGHDYDEEEDHDYNWCDDHDCTPDDECDEDCDHEEECTTDCGNDYNWCDDHDCDYNWCDDHDCDYNWCDDHDCDYNWCDDHDCDEEEETPAPTCTLDVYPSTITQGDEAVLYWNTDGATSVSISGGVGAASLDGEEGVSPLGTQTYVLTATGAGGVVTCSDTVGVIADEDEDDEELTFTNVNNNYNYNYNTYSGGSSNDDDDEVSCDSFTVSDSRVEEGDEVTLRWRTTNADDVDINQGVGDVSDDGSETVTVKRDTTFTLTARGDGDTDTCRVSVKVDEDDNDDNDNDELRCEFSVSDTAIRTGESVILSWVNDATDRLVLKEGTKTLIDSKKDSDIDEDVDVITVKPTKSTKYTLDVYDGNKKETCVLNVEVGKGMVSGISLSQVPYTGFEAGPMLTAIFYGAIVLWGLVLAYALVLKKKHSRILSK